MQCNRSISFPLQDRLNFKGPSLFGNLKRNGPLLAGPKLFHTNSRFVFSMELQRCIPHQPQPQTQEKTSIIFDLSLFSFANLVRRSPSSCRGAYRAACVGTPAYHRGKIRWVCLYPHLASPVLASSYQPSLTAL